MSRMRLFTLLTACLVLASAAWADDQGYVDCTSHPESAQIFSKARQTPDSLGTVACGERFSILVYGFVFSRVATRDGKVGYLYSNLITIDRGGAAPSPAATRVAAPSSPAAAREPNAAKMDPAPATTSLSRTRNAVTPPGQVFPTPPVPAESASSMASASAQPAPAASSSPAPPPAAGAPSAPAPAPTAESAPTPLTPAPEPTPAPSADAAKAPAPAPRPSAQPTPPAPSQPSAPAPAEAQAATPDPPASRSSAASQLGSSFPTPPPTPPDSAPAPTPAAADRSPEPAPAADPAPDAPQPQPEQAQPARAPVPSARSSWESPVPGVRQSFLLELYSGYSLARFTGSGAATNLNGGMGSLAYNLKPWLQIGGDMSFNLVTINGVKNTLYGNHFGGRFLYHRFSRFTPFAEGLVGGSRLDTSGSVKTSTNCISYKVGGGIDYRASRRWEIRLLEFDYYRTNFGAGGYTAAQNNYWASAGVVLRLFGSGASE